uniref:Uncharacterized protein n=1 Tax=Solanum lycopersicum TaxID=4081 RepID=A0A3Q7HEQ5_SOLLC
MEPTTNEELKLRLFPGDISQLGPAERFCKSMVEALLLMCSLQEEVSSIKESFTTLEFFSVDSLLGGLPTIHFFNYFFSSEDILQRMNVHLDTPFKYLDIPTGLASSEGGLRLMRSSEIVLENWRWSWLEKLECCYGLLIFRIRRKIRRGLGKRNICRDQG